VTYVFGDGLDCYAATADMLLGYWDGGLGTNVNLTLQPGRFAGGQALQFGGAAFVLLTKSSAVNDAVHHISVAYRQTLALSGTTLGLYFQFIDNVTNQCCIVFRSDGTILLTSATPAGTTLATYAGAVTAQNTWFQFEFEVVINNTSGSFKARKNGNSTDDHSTTGINTRPGANSYANKLTVGQQATFVSWQIDDLLWRSDAAAVPWLGDIRAYTRMPASDASVTFTRTAGATNASCVDEPQQNALTDYVFSANVNDADFYTIGTTATTPATVVAVTTRGFISKSDAGVKGAAVQLKSGATTVTSTPTLLSTTFGWLWRTDTTDPATGAAWTNGAVNSVQIGPKVTS